MKHRYMAAESRTEFHYYSTTNGRFKWSGTLSRSYIRNQNSSWNSVSIVGLKNKPSLPYCIMRHRK